MLQSYNLGDKVRMKKAHPCGSNLFTIIRCGMDVKIRCDTCQRVIMLERHVFEKKAKEIIPSAGK